MQTAKEPFLFLYKKGVDCGESMMVLKSLAPCLIVAFMSSLSAFVLDLENFGVCVVYDGVESGNCHGRMAELCLLVAFGWWVALLTVDSVVLQLMGGLYQLVHK